MASSHAGKKPKDSSLAHQDGPVDTKCWASRRKKVNGLNSKVGESDSDESADILTVFMKVRRFAGAIVENDLFKNAVIMLIVVNALMMGIGTFDFVTQDEVLKDGFENTDRAFLIIFTIELILHFIDKGHRLFCDGWLNFDFVIVILSWSLDKFQVIRAFRIFRALRLITRIRVLKNLVGALLSVLPRMAAIGCLMGLIFYIFAVMFTSLFKEVPNLEEQYFRRLDSSLFTLFQMMTLDWSGVARDLMKHKWWAWMPVVCFIMISSFIVYNLIVAVICDAIFVLHDLKEDENSGNDGSSTASSDDDEFDVMALKRIDDLAQQVKMLQENQLDIQDNLEKLAGTLKDLDMVVIPDPAPQDI